MGTEITDACIELQKLPEYNNLLLNAIVVIVSYVNLHVSYYRSLCY